MSEPNDKVDLPPQLDSEVEAGERSIQDVNNLQSQDQEDLGDESVSSGEKDAGEPQEADQSIVIHSDQKQDGEQDGVVGEADGQKADDSSKVDQSEPPVKDDKKVEVKKKPAVPVAGATVKRTGVTSAVKPAAGGATRVS